MRSLRPSRRVGYVRVGYVVAGLALLLGTAACARSVEGAGRRVAAPAAEQKTSTPPRSHTPSSSPTPPTTPNAGYDFRIRIADTVTDCATHSYGRVAGFFAAYRCGLAHRQLVTATVDGKPVVFTREVISMPSSSISDPWGLAGRLKQLLDQDGSGSLNDLLREGHTFPGGPTRPLDPSTYWSTQDHSLVTVVVASYRQAYTQPRDPALLAMAAASERLPISN